MLLCEEIRRQFKCRGIARTSEGTRTEILASCSIDLMPWRSNAFTWLHAIRVNTRKTPSKERERERAYSEVTPVNSEMESFLLAPLFSLSLKIDFSSCCCCWLGVEDFCTFSLFSL